MNSIFFAKELVEKIARARLACIYFSVQIQESDEHIKSFSENVIEGIRSQIDLDGISQRSAIKEAKDAYRILGKDPSRYRPSAEALTRRVVGGKELYRINNVVDVLNLISIESGFSIGGYDAEKIMGDVQFGIGTENEPYQAIGRGALNIASLPLFRDDLGPFGSPTSDSQRTMVTEQTDRFLMIIIDFNRNEKLQIAMERAIELYSKFGVGSMIETKLLEARP